MTDAEELPKIKDLDDEDFQICTISFSPPVYQQRYRVILDLVSGLKPKKVRSFSLVPVDNFACACGTSGLVSSFPQVGTLGSFAF